MAMTCRKTNYKTPRMALKAMHRIIARSTKGPIPVRYYYCHEHHAYHLTSKPKGKRNAED